MICIVIIGYLTFLLIFFLSYSDVYNKIKFKKEFKKDVRFEELFHLERAESEWDEPEYDIGIKLKDGKKIAGKIYESIYYLNTLREIGNYRINTLELWYHGYDSEWYLYHKEGISTQYLIQMIKNQPDYKYYRLNDIIYYYDEIIEFLEKIHSEDPIPGAINEGRNINMNEWGDEKELEKYTGYFSSRWNMTDNRLQLKIYVEYIDND